MKNTATILSAMSLALLLGACGSSTPRSSTTPATHTGQRPTMDMTTALSPKKWFVELAGDPTSLSSLSIGSQQATFRAQAAQRGIQYQELQSYHTLFNGFTVLATQTQLNHISTLPGVIGVYPVQMVANPRKGMVQPLNLQPLDVYSGSMIGADVAQNEYGLTGAGVKVGVIDTGIDAGHPAFTGRIVAGYDFVGDKYDAGGTGDALVLHPDPTPNDCAGHGTHVSGIIGGNDPTTGYKGVAPGVSFGEYKIFGCDGTSGDDVILLAMEKATADGMNVVNMSLGSGFGGWSETPLAQAASRMVKKGIVMAISAGNDGASGVYSLGTPASGDNVIAVASVGNTKLDLSSFTITPDGSKVGYLPADGAPAPGTTTALTITKKAGSTTATTNDGCTASGAFPAGSLTGKAVLIRRGGCTFYEKASNAQKAGAAAVILYNNAYGYLSPTVVPAAGDPAITIPVVSISATDGAKIDGLIGAGVTAKFNVGTTTVDNPSANTIDSYSSYGMTPELEFKPDIAAPGGNIKSTWPLSLIASGYNTISGTSMASPHVAGAAALMLQARPSLAAKDMRALLMNTATLRYFRAADGTMNPAAPDYVQRQGGGMVNIVGAYNSTVQATPEKLSLGDSSTFTTRSKVVVLKNSSATAQVFTVTHVPALTLGGTTLAPKPSTVYATVSVNGTSVDGGSVQVTVPAMGEAELNVVVTPPSGAPDKSQYGGYLSLSSTAGSNMTIPYSGFKGDYQSIQVLDDPGLYDSGTKTAYAETDPVTTPIDFTMAGQDLPLVYFVLDHQARTLRMDVLNSTGATVGNYFTEPYWSRSPSTADYYQIPWDGTLSDGSSVPNGTYKLRLKVLKALGDPSNPADTETYTSQSFKVARP
ncbi:peptidase S8 [Deinococcus sp. KSM4-11]|uniref:S8 family serine peptidase n=1 Tax=Deinococcus sp. KSM4-11 TaxID=2568654 RepID=UPI0010A2D89A|nr:S8 family serine peptidase [Deinococcus sp. KSM4-11]THF87691.1 peptidase S8 [Deinococcus sp. KSM4-11]